MQQDTGGTGLTLEEMTLILKAITIMAHTGWYGSHAKFPIAASPAMITPPSDSVISTANAPPMNAPGYQLSPTATPRQDPDQGAHRSKAQPDTQRRTGRHFGMRRSSER